MIPSRWVGGAWHPSSACTPLSSSRSRISAKQRRTEVPAGFPQLLAHVLPFLSGKSFREQQCEKYNGYNLTDLEGNRLEWVPKYAGVSPRDRCKLFCRARGRSEFKVFEAKVRYSVMLSCPTAPFQVKCPNCSPASPCIIVGDRWDAVRTGDPLHLRPRAVHQGWLRSRRRVLQEAGQVRGVRRQRLDLQEDIRLAQPIQVRGEGVCRGGPWGEKPSPRSSHHEPLPRMYFQG